MPNCFFQLIPDAEQRKGDTLKDFAELVLQNYEEA